MPDMTPDKVKENLSSDQYKIYKLIWDRFIASQMANCIQSTTQVDIIALNKSKKSSETNYIFKASGYTVDFDGFTVLYTEGKDTEQEKS